MPLLRRVKPKNRSRGRRGILLACIALCAALVTVPPERAESQFLKDVEFGTNPYRLVADYDYKGEKVHVDIVADCRTKYLVWKGNDSSYEEAMTPVVWGQRLHDGAGFMISLPAFCDGQTTANGLVPSNFMPMLVMFDSMDAPWEGWGYESIDAYERAESPIKFLGARIENASHEMEAKWRAEQAPKNTITYDLLPRNVFDPFRKKPWGNDHFYVPDYCWFYDKFTLDPQFARELNDRFLSSIIGEKPEVWSSSAADSAVWEKMFKYSKNPVLDAYGRNYSYKNYRPIYRSGILWGNQGLDQYYSNVYFETYPLLTQSNSNIKGIDEVINKNNGSISRVLYNKSNRGLSYCGVMYGLDGQPQHPFSFIDESYINGSISINIGGKPFSYQMHTNDSYWVNGGRNLMTMRGRL